MEEKEINEMTSTQTYSIKIKNVIKIKDIANKEKINKSKTVNKMIEEYK